MKKRNYVPPHGEEENQPIHFPPEPTPIMLCNMITKIFDDYARNDDISLTNSGRQIMRFLSRHEGVTQLELANAANIKAPTVSVTLQKMEADGIVRRETDEHDLRQTRVYLTEKGHAFNEKVKSKIDTMDAVAISDFSQEEQVQLNDMLKHIITNMIDYKENKK